jgi:hypothetical protein
VRWIAAHVLLSAAMILPILSTRCFPLYEVVPCPEQRIGFGADHLNPRLKGRSRDLRLGCWKVMFACSSPAKTDRARGLEVQTGGCAIAQLQSARSWLPAEWIPGNLALGEMTGTLWRTFDLQELCQVMEQRQEAIQDPECLGNYGKAGRCTQ